ncbi:hypothetical protein NP233_g11145 [Leucocoprinus birnbaumii]|uniref:Nephrocystin 3-like N-terminal domain-containing protein n=1 Tax=Leucocoprinus birnbaumii TaxID=56174 RepID=A0AAD5VHY7_9AGAR|nr:hypothetical protein NP233_g11145 [Leucocoprinus birnbaumii]
MATASSETSGLEMFCGAHNFAVNKLHQTGIDNSIHISMNETRERPGLDRLLEYSMRDAFYDSCGRWPPPRCHYDSRLEIRNRITDWATGHSVDITEFLLWIYGPFGVGKTAIAQSCADTLADENVLGGSLFFSRPNNRNDPDRIFLSLAYQLALKSPLLADVLERTILKKPTLITAARPIQFEELLVKPLREVEVIDSRIQGWTIILDGLDEVNGTDAQCDIIKIIVASIRDRTTPFRWLVVSRPEPHIQRAMRAKEVSPLVSTLDLPLSPQEDHEILTFFTRELEKIGEQHNLSPLWCSEADIAALVKFSNGLWVCVDTITRFVGSSSSLGPATQLRLVLSLTQTKSSSINPLEAMDSFYNLIMQQIPSQIISTVQKILLLNHVFIAAAAEVEHILELSNVLQLSREEFYAACGFLQSVLCVQNNVNDLGQVIHFYHASFMEYMHDKHRSEMFCIYGKSLDELQREVIERINEVHSRSTGDTPLTIITYPRTPPNNDDHFLVYYALVASLLVLCGHNPYCLISPSNAALLSKVAFSKIHSLLKRSPCAVAYAKQDQR